MATPLELADITRRLVEELSGVEGDISASTSKLFSALNTNERATVQAQARQQLASVKGEQQLGRIRLQGEQQLRRDQLKADAELSKLRVKTEADTLRRRTPSVAQELRLKERSRKIRLSEARERIRLARGGQIPTTSALESISLLGEVDPDAARTLRRRFQPPAVEAPAFGSSPGQPVPRETSLLVIAGFFLCISRRDIGFGFGNRERRLHLENFYRWIKLLFIDTTSAQYFLFAVTANFDSLRSQLTPTFWQHLDLAVIVNLDQFLVDKPLEILI